MNREQRRAQKKAARGQPKYVGMTKDQRIDALIKNGITPQDLEKSYKDGFEAGFDAACVASIKTAYAAVCLALNDKHGFGRRRCAETLQAIDQYVLNTLTSTEAVDEVFQRMKLTLDFGEAFDRIIETE